MNVLRNISTLRHVEIFTAESILFPLNPRILAVIETSESWYVVRNTRGVTGFVGPDSKPVPLTQEEVDMMLNTEQSSVDFGFAIGENVRILSGPLENFSGVVEDVDTVRGKLTVKVQMFLGREMPVEVDLDQVEKEK